MGVRICDLGIQKMPDGYELMQDDDGYYFWRKGNLESGVSWNRWAVRRGAIEHAKQNDE